MRGHAQTFAAGIRGLAFGCHQGIASRAGGDVTLTGSDSAAGEAGSAPGRIADLLSGESGSGHAATFGHTELDHSQSKQDLLDQATKLDKKYGSEFNPPIK